MATNVFMPQRLACEWPAKVGFLEGRNIAIVGYAGFLEHFNTTFNTARHRVTLRTNQRFPGTAV